MSLKLKGALAIGATLLMAGAAHAATGTAVSALNVRGGPGTNYPVIDTLPGGERITVLGCSSGWCEIGMGASGTGFVSQSFLDIDGGGGPRERVIIESPEPDVITGLSIGGYWGDSPYYYDDGFYYYGGRWYGVRPGRPGWERSWSRDHHRRGRDWNGPRGGWNGPDRGPGRDGPGRDGPGRDGPGRDGPGRDGPRFGDGPGRGGPDCRPGRGDGPRQDGPGRDGFPGRDGGPGRDRPDGFGRGPDRSGGMSRPDRDGGSRGGEGRDRGDRVGLDRAGEGRSR